MTFVARGFRTCSATCFARATRVRFIATRARDACTYLSPGSCGIHHESLPRTARRCCGVEKTRSRVSFVCFTTPTATARELHAYRRSARDPTPVPSVRGLIMCVWTWRLRFKRFRLLGIYDRPNGAIMPGGTRPYAVVFRVYWFSRGPARRFPGSSHAFSRKYVRSTKPVLLRRRIRRRRFSVVRRVPIHCKPVFFPSMDKRLLCNSHKLYTFIANYYYYYGTVR